MPLQRVAASLTCALTLFAGGCSQSFFRQSINESMIPATSEEIAAEHQPQALRDDLDALVRLHEEACPDPYLRTDKSTIYATRDRLQASIQGPMRRRDFLPLVMEMQAAYGVDHIMQAIQQEDLVAALDAGELLLPFRAVPSGDELLVVAVSQAESHLEPGDRIRTIGGSPAAATIGRLRALVPGEVEQFKAMRIRDSFRALSWAAGIKPPIEVGVRRVNGKEESVTLNGVGREARRNERTAEPSRAAQTTGEVIVDESPFRCTIVEGDIALIDFPTMDGGLAARWDTFLDHAIDAANQRGCVGLIVDVRRNGGGDSNLGDALLAHLTDKPYRMTAGIIWRKSEQGHETLRLCVKPAWRWLLGLAMPIAMPEYAKLENGEDATITSEVTAPASRSPRFTGPTCLLIGEGTFSSAMMLADAARAYDLMTTVGEPTGGLPTSLGELGFSELPNSRLRVQFCQKKFLRASGDPTDVGPVVPHVVVPADSHGDAALKRAIEEIRRRGSSVGFDSTIVPSGA